MAFASPFSIPMTMPLFMGGFDVSSQIVKVTLMRFAQDTKSFIPIELPDIFRKPAQISDRHLVRLTFHPRFSNANSKKR